MLVSAKSYDNRLTRTLACQSAGLWRRRQGGGGSTKVSPSGITKRMTSRTITRRKSTSSKSQQDEGLAVSAKWLPEPTLLAGEEASGSPHDRALSCIIASDTSLG